MKITRTQSYHFSAAHRMWNAALSEEQNRLLYGKCANDDGHGHNYEFEVTLGGAPDPQSGQIIARGDVDAAVEPILQRLDHHHINQALNEAGYPVSTSEALSAALWDWLQPVLGERLVGIRVIETERNSFEYFGGKGQG
jgi:6-pyruvoyltetrahydropterin/6-carboxytetrahydropterin synthase